MQYNGCFIILSILQNNVAHSDDLEKLDATLTEAMKEQSDMIEKNETSLKVHGESLSELEKAVTESFEAANKVTDKVGNLEAEVNKIQKLLGEMQVRKISSIWIFYHAGNVG